MGARERLLAAAQELGQAAGPGGRGTEERATDGYYLGLLRRDGHRTLILGRVDRRPSYEEAEAVARAIGVAAGSEPEPAARWLATQDGPARKVLALVYRWSESDGGS